MTAATFLACFLLLGFDTGSFLLLGFCVNVRNEFYRYRKAYQLE
jgi:hypothetical protein